MLWSFVSNAISYEGFIALTLHLRYKAQVRPVSNVVLLPCYAGSTVARLQLDISTTWFQTSNLIQSNRTAVAENKAQKKRNGLANF